MLGKTPGHEVIQAECPCVHGFVLLRKLELLIIISVLQKLAGNFYQVIFSLRSGSPGSGLMPEKATEQVECDLGLEGQMRFE